MKFKYYLALLDFKFDRRNKEYKDLERAYNIYVDKIATMFSLLDITDPAIVCSVFNNLLNIGKLSCTRNIDKNICDGNNVLDPNVVGSVIAAGMGVCRNKSGLLCDVLNAMGYDACTLVGTYKKNKEPDHVIVGVSSNTGRFAFDASNGKFLNSFSNNEYNPLVLYGNNKTFFTDINITKCYAKMNNTVESADKFFDNKKNRFISIDTNELYDFLAKQIIKINSKQINGSIYFLMTNDMFVLNDLQKEFVKKTDRKRIRK